MKLKELECFIGFINKFINLYDIMRVVEPITNTIIHKEKLSTLTDCSCYEFWENDALYDNGTSMMAIQENDTFVKVEYNKEKVFIMMCSPIILDGQKYVVEMIKDVSHTGVIPNLDGKSMDEINAIIQKLNQEVITDELTRIFNRRYINERVPADISEAINNKSPLSFILVDIDFFKNVNDTFGHQAGDYVLKELTKIIHSAIRHDVDWVGRYGGEEFVISLYGADKVTAMKIADRILKCTEDEIFIYEEHIIRITVSMGCYTMINEELSFNELLRRVDNNLYIAKKNGRNQVVSN